MNNGIYATLTRQSGLMREMQTIANNIANANTAGFKREGVIFSEYMVSLDRNGETLSMAHARGRKVDLSPGPLTQTNGKFDIAIEGDGFFLVQTPEGPRLTRAGAFTPNGDGEIVDMNGHYLLDDGQALIAIPDGVQSIGIGPDGTITADDAPIGQVGVYTAPSPAQIFHQDGTLFVTDAQLEPMENPTIRQGFIEDSNVQPVQEIGRMIEVQRAYELGQSFLDREDERIRSVITSLTR